MVQRNVGVVQVSVVKFLPKFMKRMLKLLSQVMAMVMLVVTVLRGVMVRHGAYGLWFRG